MLERVILWALLVGLIAGPSALMAQDEKDADENTKAIQGMWDVYSIEIAGKASRVPEEAVYVFTREQVMVKEKGKPDRDASYKIRPGKTPKELDFGGSLVGDKGTILAVYELEGDTLKIAYSIKGTNGKRPGGVDADDVVHIRLARSK